MAAPTPQNKQILVARLYIFLSIEKTLDDHLTKLGGKVRFFYFKALDISCE